MLAVGSNALGSVQNVDTETDIVGIANQASTVAKVVAPVVADVDALSDVPGGSTIQNGKMSWF